MDPNNIKNIEIDLFLEALLLRHGYDFKNYARASIKRRIIKLLNDTEHQKISEMIPDLLYHESFFQKCIYNFSIFLVLVDICKSPMASTEFPDT